MSYFPVGHRVTGDEIDDFNDCDPTHYGGGYDIDLTYGRSLPPSYETCYPHSSASGYFDYNRPQFASHAKPSAYSIEALGNEYKSYAGPIPRPGPPAFAGGRGYSGPKPNYGFQPGGGGSEHGRRNEYARPEPEYGSGYGMEPPPGSNFGSSYGRSSEYERPGRKHAEPGAGYGRKPDRSESGHGPGVYGWNTGRQPVSDFGGSGYETGGSAHRGWPEKPTFPMPSYPQPTYPVPTYPEPSYPVPTYPEPSYPVPTYPEPSYPVPTYPEPRYPVPTYPEPSYPIPSYGVKKYEHGHPDDKEGKHHHSHHHRR